LTCFYCLKFLAIAVGIIVFYLSGLHGSCKLTKDIVFYYQVLGATILKITTRSNRADTLTKPLPAGTCWRHMISLLVNICPEDDGCWWLSTSTQLFAIQYTEECSWFCIAFRTGREH